MSIVDEWAGEITIQQNLKEIKNLLTSLNETVTKLKNVICDDKSPADVKEAWLAEGHWDYWSIDDIGDNVEEEE